MKMGYFLIAVGLVCLFAGIIVYVNESKAKKNTPTDILVEKKEIHIDTAPKPSVQPETARADENDEYYEKGLEFEKYIVSRFSKKYFTLKEWRGDKSIHGIYPESSTYPDMEYAFTLHGKTYNFAVECKWRARYNAENKVKWSYKEQLARYRQFAKDKNMPVFIILGIGGTPSSPENVFVVPLASIERIEVSKNWLENYRHDLSKNLFYDIPTNTLR